MQHALFRATCESLLSDLLEPRKLELLVGGKEGKWSSELQNGLDARLRAKLSLRFEICVSTIYRIAKGIHKLEKLLTRQLQEDQKRITEPWKKIIYHFDYKKYAKVVDELDTNNRHLRILIPQSWTGDVDPGSWIPSQISIKSGRSYLILGEHKRLCERSV